MTQQNDQTRRALLEFAGSTVIWVSPIIQMVKLPVHAQLSGIACTANIVPGIEVKVIDARTNANISCLSSVNISDNGYLESLQRTSCTAAELGFLQGAFERSGTYNLEISVPGYIGKIVRNIDVVKDVCHVVTISLDIRLTPI